MIMEMLNVLTVMMVVVMEEEVVAMVMVTDIMMMTLMAMRMLLTDDGGGDADDGEEDDDITCTCSRALMMSFVPANYPNHPPILSASLLPPAWALVLRRRFLKC